MAQTTDILPVRGHIEQATREGFARLIAQANVSYTDGLTLVGVVNVGSSSLGGIFVRIPKPPASTGSLV